MDEVDEVAVVAAWLDARASKLHILEAECGWAWPSSKVPRVEDVKGSVRPGHLAQPATAVA